MRLTLKVVLATVLGTLLVLIVFGSVRTHREIELFDSDMRKDHELIGSTLGVCVASTWATAGAARAVELIDRANADRAGLRIGWVHADGRMHMDAPTFPELAVERFGPTVLPDPMAPGHAFLVTRLPVRDRNVLLGVIDIAESLDARDEYTRSSIWNAMLATAALVLVSGLVVLVVGVWLVGRPLDSLAAKAKRVGQGDLTQPLHLAQRDEIGQLAGEVNSMCERLAEATEKTTRETEARIKAMEQLRHADRLVTVGKLAAGIAHELGTPLNVIAGRIKMLRRGTVDAAVGQEYLAVVAEQTDRMTTIIRQLMDFARRREPRVNSCDLVSIARSIVGLVEPLARKRGVHVRVVSDGPVHALADASRIEQVVSNLVVNAIHACSAGGNVRIATGIETLGDAHESASAYLQVSDDGHGMTPETLARIFEPFFTTKDVGAGTGLGLSVAHGIVEEHGGAIHVESEPGHGSMFSVHLAAVTR